MAGFEIFGGRPETSKETMHDIVMCMIRPYGERVGFSPDAMAAYVREKLKHMPEFYKGETRSERAYATSKWMQDNICCALLNESFGP